MGYSRAGFEVVGVDINPQPHYPFPFCQANALIVLRDGYLETTTGRTYNLNDFDAIHASPPCQAYSMACQQWRPAGKTYPDMVAETRELLIKSEKPYVVENVPGSPLLNPTILNGGIFGMRVRRTRLFETSFEMLLVLRVPEEKSTFRMGRPVKEGDVITPVGHFSNVDYARRVMGIDWMTRKELTQAIPPAYTQFIGKYLMDYLNA